MPFAESIDNSILDHYFQKASWTQPTAVYIGMSSTTPTKVGANVTEPTTGSYARIQINPADMNSAATSNTSNNVLKGFVQATADWLAGVNLTHLVIFDAVTVGTFIGSKALDVAKPVLNGDTPEYAIGDLDFTVGGTA